MNSQKFPIQGKQQGTNKLLWLGCVLLLFTLVLAACDLTAAETTEVAFEVTPYQAEGAATDVGTPASPVAAAVNSVRDTVTTTTGTAPGNTETISTTANTENAQPVAEAVAAPQAVAAAVPNTLRYSGEIAAESQVVVVAETAGMILALPLQVGDVITKGDLVAQLDTTLLEAQKAQAMVGLEAATAQLALIKTPPDPDDLAAAEAGVNAAGSAYTRATGGLTAEEQRLVLAQLKQAEAGVTVARAAYNQVKGNPAIGMMPQSLQLQQATIGLEAAQANYDKAVKGATQDVIAGAYAQLAQARAQLQRLQEGAKPEQIKAVEAQVKQAEMGIYLAQLQLDKATVNTAVDGIVSRVNSAAGAMAAPGAPLVTLLSREMKVTLAVEETRLSQLAIGQRALITVDAYPDQVFEGTVTIVAPELDPATRTVQVTVQPDVQSDEPINKLAPGMSATVELIVQ